MLPLEKTQLELESCYEIADPVEDDFEWPNSKKSLF